MNGPNTLTYALNTHHSSFSYPSPPLPNKLQLGQNQGEDHSNTDRGSVCNISTHVISWKCLEKLTPYQQAREMNSNHMLRSLMACVTGDWHTGHAASGPWHIWVAQSRQKRLWPQGTKAAITWLSIQWIQISCPLTADPSPGR